MSRRLFYEFGLCSKCGEHAQLGQECCPGARVHFEGDTWSREEVLKADAESGLACDCSECMDADEPCKLDCSLDEECFGCRQARREREEDEFNRKDR